MSHPECIGSDGRPTTAQEFRISTSGVAKNEAELRYSERPPSTCSNLDGYPLPSKDLSEISFKKVSKKQTNRTPRAARCRGPILTCARIEYENEGSRRIRKSFENRHAAKPHGPPRTGGSSGRINLNSNVKLATRH